MSLAIDLAPETERRLGDEAARHGLSPREYAQVLVEEALAVEESPQPSLWETTTPDEWIRAFDEWLDSFAQVKAPPIPAEALRRENMYDDRGL